MIEGKTSHFQQGYTLLELLITLSLGATLLGMATANLREYSRASKNSIAMVQGFIKQARVKAISRTAAYRVYSDSTGKRIATSFADTCASTTFTVDAALILDMPQGSKLLTPVWSVCINARGLAESTTTISIATEDSGTKQIEVMLGGGTREL